MKSDPEDTDDLAFFHGLKIGLPLAIILWLLLAIVLMRFVN